MAIPNTTPTPNIIFNGLMTKMSDTEFRVVMVVVRATLGWEIDHTTGMRKKEDWISHKQLIDKTGRSGRAISTAIDSAIKKGWIEARDANGNLLDKKEKRIGKKIFYRLGKEILLKNNGEEILVKEYKQGKNIESEIRYKLDTNISSAIRKCLAGRKEDRQWEKLVGYTLEDLKKHLEKQFDDKMSWNNYGTYWHLDHKIPKSWFNYKTPEDPDFKKCWALENLQPLEAKENLKKHNKYASLSIKKSSEKSSEVEKSSEKSSIEKSSIEKSSSYKRNTITKEKHNKSIRLAKPTKRKDFSFKKEDYEKVLKEYQRLRGITLQGKEFEPVLQTIKTMFMSKRSVKDIIGCMEWLAQGSEEWMSGWTIRTVRMKIPFYLSQKNKIISKKY